MLDIKKASLNFPALRQKKGEKPLVYLDSAATTMRPKIVLDAVNEFYENGGANPHRGVYKMAEEASFAYEKARETVASFAGVKDPRQIIFTRGATEGINLLAYSLAPLLLQEGDEIALLISEHHSNLVPWQFAAQKAGAKLVYLLSDENGNLPRTELESKITNNTKIVAFAQVSNVLGTHFNERAIIAKANAVGAVTVMDCAQSAPHMPLELDALDVDFAVFSGHKIYAPMGIGVLFGKMQWLEKMPPFLYGGDMIEYVQQQHSTYATVPQKFEAGTQNAGGAIGLAAAINYIQSIGFAQIQKQEALLMQNILKEFEKLPYIKVQGNASPAAQRYGVVSFTIEGVHPHDAASILNEDGVAIRAGHHCAQPLMRHLGLNSTCRASFGLYNKLQDVQALLAAIPKARRLFGYGD